MTSPIDPVMCVNTGRMLTEWFEDPVFTHEQLQQQGAEKYGLEEYPSGSYKTMAPEIREIQRQINGFVAGKKRRKWRGGMTMQEVQFRMNEATKMVSPDNHKFLDDATRERTGLEINPLWMMECLVRSGVMSPKEQIAALKELAGYTHSKAPNISHTTNTQLNPEDWLMELAKDEYKVIGEDIPIQQPMQPVEAGSGRVYEKRREKKTAEMNSLLVHRDAELAELMDQVDTEGFDA